MTRSSATIQILALLVTVWFGVRSQPVNIAVIGDPKAFCEMVAREGETTLGALERLLPRDGELWLVVGRRVDVWYSKGKTRVERRTLLKSAAAEIDRAKGYPVFADPAETVAKIQAQVLSSTGGTAASNVLWIGNTRIGQGIPPPIDFEPRDVRDTVVKKGQAEDSDGVIAPSPSSVTKTFGLLLVGCVVLLFGGLKKLRTRQQEEEEMEQWFNEKKQQLDGFQVQSKDTEPREEWVKDAPPVQSEARPRGTQRIFLNGLMVILLLFFTARSNSQDLRFLDASLSDAVAMRETAKQEIALRILNKRPVDLWLFGDSIRYVGRISSLRQLDSVFFSLPGDKKTRLAEALTQIKRIVDEARRKGQRPLLTIYTDYVEDDANNRSLTMGLMLPVPRPDTSRVDTSLVAESHPTFEGGIILGAIGVIVPVALGGLLLWRKRKGAGSMNARRISIAVGPNGTARSIEQLIAQPVRLGPDFDADVRSFNVDPQELSAKKENGKLCLKLVRRDEKRDPLLVTLSS